MTQGSQQAIYLAAQTVLSPGDVVAVERLGYQPAFEALRCAGVRLKPYPIDERGLQVERLEQDAEKIRAVYLTPHHHFPTTVSLSQKRRAHLLSLARKHRWLILEDDYDHELHYEGPPILPLASGDGGAHVLYIGSFSKVLAPGLRVGYLCGAKNVIDRVATRRRVVDRQGNPIIEAALAEWLEEGGLRRHLTRAKRLGLERRDATSLALRECLPWLRFRIPSGGMTIWAEAGKRAPELQEAAARAGYRLRTSAEFSIDGRERGGVRFGFARHRPSEIARALRRISIEIR